MRQLFEWHNMGKWIQKTFSAFSRSLPNGNMEVLIYGFFKLKFLLSLWGRMRNCYLIFRSQFKFLDLYKFRDCSFLPRVHFASHSSNNGLNGWLEFKEGGYRYWIKQCLEFKGRYGCWIRHFGKANGKIRIDTLGLDTGSNSASNKIGVSILIFLDGILPLKVRHEKIRLTFIESNISWDKKIF